MKYAKDKAYFIPSLSTDEGSEGTKKRGSDIALRAPRFGGLRPLTFRNPKIRSPSAAAYFSAIRKSAAQPQAFFYPQSAAPLKIRSPISFRNFKIRPSAADLCLSEFRKYKGRPRPPIFPQYKIRPSAAAPIFFRVPKIRKNSRHLVSVEM